MVAVLLLPMTIRTNGAEADSLAGEVSPALKRTAGDELRLPPVPRASALRFPKRSCSSRIGHFLSGARATCALGADKGSLKLGIRPKPRDFNQHGLSRHSRRQHGGLSLSLPDQFGEFFRCLVSNLWDWSHVTTNS